MQFTEVYFLMVFIFIRVRLIYSPLDIKYFFNKVILKLIILYSSKHMSLSPIYDMLIYRKEIWYVASKAIQPNASSAFFYGCSNHKFTTWLYNFLDLFTTKHYFSCKVRKVSVLNSRIGKSACPRAKFEQYIVI